MNNVVIVSFWCILYTLLLVYLVPTLLMIVLFTVFDVSSVAQLKVMFVKGGFWKVVPIILILNLMGAPLLPGFFLKVNLLVQLVFWSKKLVGVLVIFNFIIFNFYLNFLKKLFFTGISSGILISRNITLVTVFSITGMLCLPVIWPYLSVFIFIIGL